MQLLEHKGDTEMILKVCSLSFVMLAVMGIVMYVQEDYGYAFVTSIALFVVNRIDQLELKLDQQRRY